jgi:uncharacterized protein (TIGR03382 family)
MKEANTSSEASMRKALASAVVLGLLVVPSIASASNPASAWADVEEVTFEPDAADATTATRVIIKGVFARSNMDASFPTYAAPARGYFYYECPSGKLDLCRLEWKDIAAAKGTSNCAGWGDGARTPGTVRAWCDAKGTAEVYPLHMGVQRTPWANGTCDGLKAFAAAPTCGGSDAGPVDSGSTTPPADTGTVAAADTGTSSPPADTGTPAATPAKGTDDGSGCSVGMIGANNVFGIAPLALVALGLLSRRRR